MIKRMNTIRKDRPII